MKNMAIDHATMERLRAMPEAELRDSVAQGLASTPGSEHHLAVLAVITEKESARAADASARKEAREEERLSISRKALANSRSATAIAKMAMILSTIMAIQKVMEWYSK